MQLLTPLRNHYRNCIYLLKTSNHSPNSRFFLKAQHIKVNYFEPIIILCDIKQNKHRGKKIMFSFK